MTGIFRTSAMISTVMRSREAQRSVQSDSPVRTEPRRNSIPPMKTAAKHLLAYLPRPQQESSCQPPNTLKVQMYYVFCWFIHLDGSAVPFRTSQKEALICNKTGMKTKQLKILI